MRGVVDVVTQAEYDAYIIKQEPKYKTAVLDKLKEEAAAADTTAKAIAAVVKK
jgi:heme/copper-type cytochrome/quinol oxidase subunit 2